MGNVSVFLIGVYGRTNGKTKSWSETSCCLATTHFINDVYGGISEWSVKNINKQSCESSSRSTSASQLLAGSTKQQDFVWEMYVNQALEDVRLLDLSVIIGNVNAYRTTHYLNYQTHSVNDSLLNLDWVFREIPVKNFIAGMLLACPISMALLPTLC